MPASRMLSAISLGVFCRTAPSTSAIMRSMKVEPWAAVMRTRIWSESTRVPPVTAERSPPLSRMTGADLPVIADLSTEATPSTISPSDGIRSPASTRTRSPGLRVECRDLAPVAVLGRGHELGLGLGAGAPQGGRLRLAAALGHGFGQVREQQRDPQPADDLGREADTAGPGGEVAHQEHGGEHGDDLDHEHDRVLDHRPRVELAEHLGQRRQQDRRVEQRGHRHPLALPMALERRRLRDHDLVSAQNRVPPSIARCSTIGPRARAGKKVRPPTIRMTPTSRPTNRAPLVGRVPSEGGRPLLGGERASHRQHRHDHAEAAEQHRDAQGRVVEQASWR